MSTNTTIRDLAVLKFGSSVLRTEADLPTAVTEIYRHLREGRRVLAVVSAFAGTTDRLLAKIRHYSEAPQPAAVAALLATGELTSSALLALHLERSGVPVTLLDVRQIDLRTRGPLLDSEPVDVDVDAIAAALTEAPVAILPGFIGTGGGGRTMLLGRGGSDLSALFIAHRTGAGVCRLVKDVDGLYESDPAAGGHPRRFAQVAYDDALQLDPRSIQPKGVRFARDHDMSFEVTCCGSAAPTVIGKGPTAFDEYDGRGDGEPLRVCLLGLGTVGLGVYRLMERDRRFEVVSVAVTDPAKHAEEHLPDGLLHDDADTAAAVPHDLLVELIGGRNRAAGLIDAALQRGNDVVTANKTVIAMQGERLRELAAERGARLHYSAAVGGGMPALEVVGQIAAHAELAALQGVLNGTTNFVLDRMATGVDQATAIAEAQARGFAEADPTFDLNGFDAACKLAILVETAFGVTLDPAAIPREGIEELTADAVKAAFDGGRVTRLVASARLMDEGLVCRVGPSQLAADHPLAQIHEESNRLLIETADGARRALTGKGAGRWPTAESVFADLCAVALARAGAHRAAARPAPTPSAG